MADNIDPDTLRKAGFSTSEGGGARSEQAAAMDEARQHMLKSILSADAKERLNRVSLVKPEIARQVEDYFIHLARTGKLADKVEENSVISVLDKLSEGAGSGTVKKITIMRKKQIDDSDDDDDF